MNDENQQLQTNHSSTNIVTLSSRMIYNIPSNHQYHDFELRPSSFQYRNNTRSALSLLISKTSHTSLAQVLYLLESETHVAQLRRRWGYPAASRQGRLSPCCWLALEAIYEELQQPLGEYCCHIYLTPRDCHPRYGRKGEPMPGSDLYKYKLWAATRSLLIFFRDSSNFCSRSSLPMTLAA